MRRRSWFLTVLGLALIAVPSDAFAQRRGGSRSRSTTRVSKPKASKPKAAKQKRGKSGGKASAKKGSWGSGKKKAGKSKKVTKEDQKAYDRAKAAGKTAPNRAAAMDKFRNNPVNAKKYTSTYASQPATRPGHIPRTTIVGGAQTTIIYNQASGGYGYMNSLGTFILYNAMADVAMRPYYDRQLASAGYVYGPRPVVVTGFGMGSVVVVLLGVIIVMVVFFRMRGGSSPSYD